VLQKVAVTRRDYKPNHPPGYWVSVSLTITLDEAEASLKKMLLSGHCEAALGRCGAFAATRFGACDALPPKADLQDL
jgi:hypothetical protein